MTYPSVTYHEDFFTLRGMTGHFNLSEELLREVQKHGLLLPEIVKFGSEEIEIYSNFDVKIGVRIRDDLEMHVGLSNAIISAQEHIAQLYHEAHAPTDTETAAEPAQMQSAHRRRKLFVLGELLEALDIDEEVFQQIRRHIQVEPVRLQVPGETIEYYFEDDYLKLRYIVSHIGEGCPLEEAARVAYDWGMFKM